MQLEKNQLPVSVNDNVIKNTMVNYHSNFNPTFSMVKMMQYITAILVKNCALQHCLHKYHGNLLIFYSNYQGNVAL